MDFAQFVPVEVQRQALEADRQRIIGEGYDLQRARDRVKAIDPVMFADQIAQHNTNISIMTKALAVVDDQIAALTQPQQPANKGQ